MSQHEQPLTSQDDVNFVQELAWKMLDGCLEEEEAEQLDLLLTHSEVARQAYTKVVQLHVDLVAQFGALPNCEEMIKKAIAAASANPGQASPAKAANSPPPIPQAEIPTTERTGT